MSVQRTDYKTRKEYKWAKKNEARQKAKEHAGLKFAGSAVIVLVAVLTKSVAVALVGIVVLGFYLAIQDDRKEKRESAGK